MMVFRARTVWWNEIGSLTFRFDDLLYVYVPLGSCGHAPCFFAICEGIVQWIRPFIAW